MLICGVKLTHDATVALVKDSKLLFSIELEKLNNNPRHSIFYLGLDGFQKLLNDYGYEMGDLDKIVFDGWHTEHHHEYIFEDIHLQLAPYGSRNNGNLLNNTTFNVESFQNGCVSYKHVSGHAMSAYCSSPFAKEGKDSFLLTWDGGMFPQLYYYSFKKNAVSNVANLFTLTCGIYNRFGHLFSHLGIFTTDYHSVPGKMMAFAALGEVREDLLAYFIQHLSSANNNPERLDLADIERIDAQFIAGLKMSRLLQKYSPPDIIASFQEAIGVLLIQTLRNVCSNLAGYERNLCYSGGAALNITWNTAIRNSGIFERCWVPPFANDSGSAIGTACCEMLASTEHRALEWDVYSGPRLNSTTIGSEWERYQCSVGDLAFILHEFGEPIVFLNGSAELGPRALGSRSILAPPVDRTMQHHLNVIKDREYYRPVAPVCLEEDAPTVFTPGTPDPYMLFTHYVRNEWKKRVPAICHTDGTARLQTVNKTQNATLHELLTEYKKLSGIPLLCNTSANLKGSGFFPDVASAIGWGKTNLVWSDGFLYTKRGYNKYLYKLVNRPVEIAEPV